MRINKRGFTLLEMLIGITLMALLMVAVLIGLRVAVKAWQEGRARISVVNLQQERTDFMAKQVNSLVPFQVNSTDPNIVGQFPILEGEPSCLRFLSTYGSGFRNRSGLMLVEYGLATLPGGNQDLYLRERGVANDDQLLHRLIERVGQDPDTGENKVFFRPCVKRDSSPLLLENLQQARFEYLAPADPAGPAHWVGVWKPQQNAEFPLVVRLSWVEEGRPEETMFPIRAHTLAQ